MPRELGNSGETERHIERERERERGGGGGCGWAMGRVGGSRGGVVEVRVVNVRGGGGRTVRVERERERGEGGLLLVIDSPCDERRNTLFKRENPR